MKLKSQKSILIIQELFTLISCLLPPMFCIFWYVEYGVFLKLTHIYIMTDFIQGKSSYYLMLLFK